MLFNSHFIATEPSIITSFQGTRIEQHSAIPHLISWMYFSFKYSQSLMFIYQTPNNNKNGAFNKRDSSSIELVNRQDVEEMS